jgi:hypothetical protein
MNIEFKIINNDLNLYLDGEMIKSNFYRVMPLNLAWQITFKKWKSIIELAEDKIFARDGFGITSCGLCLKYNNTVQNDCEGCPIYKYTSSRYCSGTPFDEFTDFIELIEDRYTLNFDLLEADTEKYISLAKTELSFLEEVYRAQQEE